MEERICPHICLLLRKREVRSASAGTHNQNEEKEWKRKCAFLLPEGERVVADN